MTYLKDIGKYLLLMQLVFQKPQKKHIFFKNLLIEIDEIGINSIGIVAIISVFMGAIIAIQTAFNIDDPLIPDWTVGFTVRSSMILEFAPTIISLILAGKVGSRIASEIGTMRVSEQIDALEIMGVNSANHLILPKIVATMLINPILIACSMFLGLLGGWLACHTGIVAPQDYVEGMQLDFHSFDITYALTKTVVFAFIISSVSGYYGYKVKGGALEVGIASTKSVVKSSILIILFNLILTQILLG